MRFSRRLINLFNGRREKGSELIDQILDLQKALDDLTSRLDGAWKFQLSGLIKITTQIVLKNANIKKSDLVVW